MHIEETSQFLYAHDFFYPGFLLHVCKPCVFTGFGSYYKISGLFLYHEVRDSNVLPSLISLLLVTAGATSKANRANLPCRNSTSCRASSAALTCTNIYGRDCIRSWWNWSNLDSPQPRKKRTVYGRLINYVCCFVKKLV